jgi:hypothetical protein
MKNLGGMRRPFALVALVVVGCGGMDGATPRISETTGAELRSAAPDGCEAPAGTISASPLGAFESETRVARAKDGALAAVWISNTAAPQDGGVQSIGYRVFRPECGPGGRGGWGQVQLLTVPGFFYHSDPTVTVDAHGDFYFAFLAAEGPITAASGFPQPPDDALRVFVAKLPRGASTALAPMLVSSAGYEFDDKPWIDVTPRGAIAISYNQSDGDLVSNTVVARSTDRGATWTTSLVDDTGTGLPQLCVPTSGHRVYVSDMVFGSGNDGHVDAQARLAKPRPRPRPRRASTVVPGQPAIHVHWSDDDGVTWTAGDVNAWPGGDPNATYSIPTCAARGRDVWLAAAMAPTEDFPPLSQTVQLAHFVDGGATFDRVVLPDMGGDFFYWQPLVVAGDDGELDLLSYVNRAYFTSPLRTDGTFVRLRSHGAGATWSAPDVLATNQWNGGERHGVGFQGDYVGAAPRDGGGLDVTYVPTFENVPQHVELLHLPR